MQHCSIMGILTNLSIKGIATFLGPFQYFPNSPFLLHRLLFCLYIYIYISGLVIVICKSLSKRQHINEIHIFCYWCTDSIKYAACLTYLSVLSQKNQSVSCDQECLSSADKFGNIQVMKTKKSLLVRMHVTLKSLVVLLLVLCSHILC